MKHKQNELVKIWDQIKASDKFDPNLLKKIHSVLIEKRPTTRRSDKKTNRSKKTSNRKLANTKSIFGNPMRNVSDELIEFYKNNK